MTDEITATLEPGRELDALIHEQIMGRAARLTAVGMVDAETGTTVLHYSTNMFAAWLVVEQLRKDGWYARLVYPWECYRCDFWRGSARVGAVASIEKDVCRMPLAVCRAAMMVVDARSRAVA